LTTEFKLLNGVLVRVSDITLLLAVSAALTLPASAAPSDKGNSGGVVSGIVRLEGEASKLPVETVTKDVRCCGLRKTCPRLIMGPGEAVKNAVVWLEGIPADRAASLRTVVLRQDKCEYQPHILVVYPGEQLEIVNSDPIMHNVHAYELGTSRRSVFNIAQPVRGQKSRIGPDVVKGADVLSVTCDAGHPWMSAYVIRAQHRYYAVTDGSGRFRFEGVPPGTYTLKMWHEGVAIRPSTGALQGAPPVVEDSYTAERSVTVQPRESIQVDMTFSLRSVAPPSISRMSTP